MPEIKGDMSEIKGEDLKINGEDLKLNGENPSKDNKEITDILSDLKMYEKAIRNHRNKYGKCLELLSDASKSLALRNGRRLFRFGAKVANKIEEFVKSGKLEDAQRAWCEEMGESVRKLSAVEGIGELRAAELVEAGIRDVDDLFYHTDLLTHQQIVGLEYYNDLINPIPQQEVEDIGKAIKEQVSQWREDCSMVLCGSFRRGNEQCTAVDVLVEAHGPVLGDLLPLIARLRNTGILLDTFCAGDLKFSGVCRLFAESPARRLYVRMTSEAEAPFAMLFLTGPQAFIDKIIRKAQIQDYCLNEYSMRRVNSNGVPGPPSTVKTEKDIFEILSMPFVEPQDRN